MDLINLKRKMFDQGLVLVADIKKNIPNATGALAASLELRQKAASKEFISYEVLADPEFEVVSEGRPPNSTPPPIAPILDWIRAKGLTDMSPYAISKKIGIEGIKPKNLFKDVDLNDDFYEPMLLAYGEEMDEVINEWKKSIEKTDDTSNN